MAWRVENTKSSGKTLSQLIVWCGDCGVQVVAPDNKFCAFFKFEKPYPGGVKTIEETAEKETGVDEESAPKPEQIDHFFDVYERQMKDMGN